MVTGCRYVLASQCAPETWDAVAHRPDVWIWHAVVKKEDAISAFLDRYYGNAWFGVGGGTTVATRALTLLRMAGYIRYDLFGIDCCWDGEQHHAMEQPENTADQRLTIQLEDASTGLMRSFIASPWHIKQFEDFCSVLRLNGHHYAMTVHGDGMLAYAIRTLGHGGDPASLIPTPPPTT